ARPERWIGHSGSGQAGNPKAIDLDAFVTGGAHGDDPSVALNRYTKGVERDGGCAALTEAGVKLTGSAEPSNSPSSADHDCAVVLHGHRVRGYPTGAGDTAGAERR